MPEYYDFTVTLIDAEPPVWRRFLLRRPASFADLHEAIQHACAWENYHLYEFRTKPRGQTIAMCEFEDALSESGAPPADTVKLETHFQKNGDSCLYIYDFGDNWHHQVELNGTVQRPDEFARKLVEGERAFPPEDCGGIWGYEICCEAARLSPGQIRRLEPEHRETVESRREWMGDWAPAAFELDTARRFFDR